MIPDYSHPIPRIQTPSQELETVEWLIDHFTCIESKMVKLEESCHLQPPEETNDDALAECSYAYLA